MNVGAHGGTPKQETKKHIQSQMNTDEHRFQNQESETEYFTTEERGNTGETDIIHHQGAKTQRKP